MRDSTTRYAGRSICPSVSQSATLCFCGRFWRFLHYCSCPNAWEVVFITAPAHPHATLVAVYPALFSFVMFCLFVYLFVYSFDRSFSHLLIRLFVHLFFHSFISFVRPFVRLFVRLLPPIGLKLGLSSLKLDLLSLKSGLLNGWLVTQTFEMCKRANSDVFLNSSHLLYLAFIFILFFIHLFIHI